MKAATVSVAEGKRDFSRLVKEAAENNADIVVTNRGKPMAVIVPYAEYERARKEEAVYKIMEARAAFTKSGLSSAEIRRESRKELEKRR